MPGAAPIVGIAGIPSGGMAGATGAAGAGKTIDGTGVGLIPMACHPWGQQHVRHPRGRRVHIRRVMFSTMVLRVPTCTGWPDVIPPLGELGLPTAVDPRLASSIP